MSNIENPPSQQQNQSDAEWTWKEPAITCPKCGSTVSHLGDAIEEVPLGQPTDTALGLPKPKFNQQPVDNSGHTATAKGLRMVWRVKPCGCQVQQEWASAYAAEVTRRKQGKEPQPVHVMPPEAVERKVKESAKKIAKLVAMLLTKDADTDVYDVERKLVMEVEELLKVKPDAYSALPEVQLSPSTVMWAKKTGRILPPQPGSKFPTVAEITQVLHDNQVISGATLAAQLGYQPKAPLPDYSKFKEPSSDNSHIVAHIPQPDGQPSQPVYEIGQAVPPDQVFTPIVPPQQPPPTAADKELFEKQAIQVYHELMRHQHHGEPLSNLSQRFLELHPNCIVEAWGPKDEGAEAPQVPGTPEEFLDERARRPRRKIDRRRKRS